MRDTERRLPLPVTRRPRDPFARVGLGSGAAEVNRYGSEGARRLDLAHRYKERVVACTCVILRKADTNSNSREQI